MKKTMIIGLLMILLFIGIASATISNEVAYCSNGVALIEIPYAYDTDNPPSNITWYYSDGITMIHNDDYAEETSISDTFSGFADGYSWYLEVPSYVQACDVDGCVFLMNDTCQRQQYDTNFIIYQNNFSMIEISDPDYYYYLNATDNACIEFEIFHSYTNHTRVEFVNSLSNITNPYYPYGNSGTEYGDDITVEICDNDTGDYLNLMEGNNSIIISLYDNDTNISMASLRDYENNYLIDYIQIEYALLIEECIPEWQCINYAECNASNISICLNVTDNNSCEIEFNGTLSDYDISCNYTINCTPSWECNIFNLCNASNITQCLSVYDINECMIGFNGSLEDYNENCTYTPEPYDRNSINETTSTYIIMGIVALFMIAILILVYTGINIFSGKKDK